MPFCAAAPRQTVLMAVALGLLAGTSALADPPPSGSYAAEAAAAEKARTATLDSRIRSYAARVSWRVVLSGDRQTQLCGSTGSAVHLGGGLFVSASHIADQNPTTNPCAVLALGQILVEFGGFELRARQAGGGLWTIEDGKLAYPHGNDLILLRVDPAFIVPERRADGATLCPDAPSIGAAVETATEYGLKRGHAAAPSMPDYDRIDVSAIRGDSGGGVFDPARGCLAGVVSSGGPEGANYVPIGHLRALIEQVQPSEIIGRGDFPH